MKDTEMQGNSSVMKMLPLMILSYVFTTFGQDSSWKNQILKIIGRQSSVLDLACGTGILSLMLIDSAITKVIGLDLVFDYLEIAKKKTKKLFLINGTAEILPYKNECFDSITSSYLAKYVDIEKELWMNVGVFLNTRVL